MRRMPIVEPWCFYSLFIIFFTSAQNKACFEKFQQATRLFSHTGVTLVIKIFTVNNQVVACSREILKNICFHLTACSFSLLCSWFKSFNAFVITEHLSYVLTECEVIFRLQIVDQLLLNVRISKNDISNNSLMIFYNKISLS